MKHGGGEYAEYGRFWEKAMSNEGGGGDMKVPGCYE